MVELKRGVGCGPQSVDQPLGEFGWRHTRVAVAVVCAVLVGCIAVPSPGVASTTIGSSLSATPNSGVYCPNTGCAYTWVSTSLPAGSPSLTSPVSGTIVRWRIKTGSPSGGTIQLRVVAAVGGGKYTGAGTGPSEKAASKTTSTYSAQLPIQVGEYIGLNGSVAADGYLLPFASSQSGVRRSSRRLWPMVVPPG
jgi:hypothetical protein